MYKPDEAFKQSIDQWIEANQYDFVKDLAKLVAIPSISVENDGPWPFGEECKNVLDKAAEIAGEYGFTVVNHEYHCGSCVVPGTGEHPKRIVLSVPVVLFMPYHPATTTDSCSLCGPGRSS